MMQLSSAFHTKHRAETAYHQKLGLREIALK